MSSSTHGGFFSSLGKADLGIVISTSLPRVRMEGDELTYLVAVTNHGPATATGIQVHDVWSKPSTTFDSSRSSSACASSGVQTADCRVQRLNPGDSTELQITLRVLSLSHDPLVDVATVAGRQIDPNLLNNLALTLTPIAP